MNNAEKNAGFYSVNHGLHEASSSPGSRAYTWYFTGGCPICDVRTCKAPHEDDTRAMQHASPRLLDQTALVACDVAIL